jgi:hypothetical protein
VAKARRDLLLELATICRYLERQHQLDVIRTHVVVACAAARFRIYAKQLTQLRQRIDVESRRIRSPSRPASSALSRPFAAMRSSGCRLAVPRRSVRVRSAIAASSTIGHGNAEKRE